LGVAGQVAVLLDVQGDTDEAKVLYLEVIHGYTARLGEDHVNTLTVKNNLAILLKNQGIVMKRKRAIDHAVKKSTVSSFSICSGGKHSNGSSFTV
jgi:hypothetical protein